MLTSRTRAATPPTARASPLPLEHAPGSSSAPVRRRHLRQAEGRAADGAGRDHQFRISAARRGSTFACRSATLSGAGRASGHPSVSPRSPGSVTRSTPSPASRASLPVAHPAGSPRSSALRHNRSRPRFERYGILTTTAARRRSPDLILPNENTTVRPPTAHGRRRQRFQQTRGGREPHRSSPAPAAPLRRHTLPLRPCSMSTLTTVFSRVPPAS